MQQTMKMGTFSGQEVWYLEPHRTEIIESDLYEHLQNQGRYAGAIKVSILFHSALCVELAQRENHTPEVVAYCAAHDLHEAYVGDIPSPLKQVLPEFGERIERPWEEHVHRSLGMLYPPPAERMVPEKVKHIDLRALVVESTMCGHPLANDIANRHGAASEDERRAFKHIRGMYDDRGQSYWLWCLVVHALRDAGFTKLGGPEMYRP